MSFNTKKQTCTFDQRFDALEIYSSQLASCRGMQDVPIAPSSSGLSIFKSVKIDRFVEFGLDSGVIRQCKEQEPVVRGINAKRVLSPPISRIVIPYTLFFEEAAPTVWKRIQIVWKPLIGSWERWELLLYSKTSIGTLAYIGDDLMQNMECMVGWMWDVVVDVCIL